MTPLITKNAPCLSMGLLLTPMIPESVSHGSQTPESISHPRLRVLPQSHDALSLTAQSHYVNLDITVDRQQQPIHAGYAPNSRQDAYLRRHLQRREDLPRQGMSPTRFFPPRPPRRNCTTVPEPPSEEEGQPVTSIARRGRSNSL